MGLSLQGFDLACKVQSADDGSNFQVDRAAQSLKVVANLHAQLPSGGQDQGEVEGRLFEQCLQDGEGEG